MREAQSNTNMIAAQWVSVWDGGRQLVSSCQVDIGTGAVEAVDPDTDVLRDVEQLDEAYVGFAGSSFPVKENLGQFKLVNLDAFLLATQEGAAQGRYQVRRTAGATAVEIVDAAGSFVAAVQLLDADQEPDSAERVDSHNDSLPAHSTSCLEALLGMPGLSPAGVRELLSFEPSPA